MLVKQDLINKIKDYFDLNIYETKVWLALLGKGVASAGEVAEISGVPRSRTYDVLESLEKKGFCIVKLGKPVKYLGVKPHIILEKLKNNARKDAEEKVEVLTKIRETEEFTQLESLFKEGINPAKREDLSAAIKGRSNITNHLREIIQNAKREVVVCTSAEELRLKTKLFKQTFDVLKKANVKVIVALSGDKALVKKVSEDLDLKVSHINIEAKFFIIDRKEILFYVSKVEDEEDLAIWLNSDFFSQAFAALFEKAMKGEK
jgi:sugar-specific transcriptional regulator TrmB